MASYYTLLSGTDSQEKASLVTTILTFSSLWSTVNFSTYPHKLCLWISNSLPRVTLRRCTGWTALQKYFFAFFFFLNWSFSLILSYVFSLIFLILILFVYHFLLLPSLSVFMFCFIFSRFILFFLFLLSILFYFVL